MPVKPISVLPKYNPVPLTNEPISFEERAGLDILQSQLAMERLSQQQQMASEMGFVNTLEKMDFNTDVPYLKNIFSQYDDKIQATAEAMKEGGAKAAQAYTGFVSDMVSDPNLRQALYEKKQLDSWRKELIDKGHLVNPQKANEIMSQIMDPKRTSSILPLLSSQNVFMSNNDAFKKFSDNLIQKSYAENIDEDNNIVTTYKTESYPANFKDLVQTFGRSIGASDKESADFAEAQIARAAATKDPFNTRQLHSDKQMEIEQQNKLALKEAGGGSANSTQNQAWYNKARYGKAPLDNGNGFSVSEDGTFSLFDKDGAVIDQGNPARVYSQLPDSDKARLNQLGYNPEKYEVNGRKIIGNEFDAIPMSTDGLTDKDKATMTGAKSYFDISGSGKDTYVDTNNVGVLKAMGYKVKKDEAGYMVYDNNGKMVDMHRSDTKEGPTFRVRMKELNPTSEIGSENVVTNYTPDPNASLEQQTLGFVMDRETDNRGFFSVNPSDNKWVSVGLQFNDKGMQQQLFDAAGKGEEWKALVNKGKPSEAAITKIFQSMTPDQQKAWADENVKLYEDEYAKPVLNKIANKYTDLPAKLGLLTPLIVDMAFQHTGGMLGSDKLFNQVTDVIDQKAKSNDEDISANDVIDLARQITKKRIDYLKNDTKLTGDTLRGSINGAWKSLANTKKLVNTMLAPAATVTPAPAAAPAPAPADTTAPPSIPPMKKKKPAPNQIQIE